MGHMAKVDAKDLEKALGSSKEENKKEQPQNPPMSKEMEVGFHQGSLTTLINERSELLRMVQQVDAVMQAHLKRLAELGVKVNTGSKK